MTVHSAKGLEFDYVFLIGMEEGIFPHNNSFGDNSALEEERRLCYVAVTRAKRKLWLVNAQRRMYFGETSCNPPSRFIDEMGEECLEKEIMEPTFTNEIKMFNKDDMVDTNVEYRFGDKVRHATFGVGVIVGIDKSLLSIAFEHPHGIKKMIKGHKSIKKI